MPPNDAGDAAPEGGEDAVAPIDDADVTTTLDGVDDIARHSLGLEHHGIMERACQQGGIDEAWADIGEPDIEAASMGLLL